MTDTERLLWQELRARRLMDLKFRRQLPIGNYIVDFACPKHKLIIELDGAGHAEDSNVTYDKNRSDFLLAQGWEVMRFWNNEITNNIDAVCDHIVTTLANKGVELK